MNKSLAQEIELATTIHVAYEAGRLLDISVLDHIIIGMKKWVSLKEKELGF